MAFYEISSLVTHIYQRRLRYAFVVMYRYYYNATIRLHEYAAYYSQRYVHYLRRYYYLRRIMYRPMYSYILLKKIVKIYDANYFYLAVNIDCLAENAKNVEKKTRKINQYLES